MARDKQIRQRKTREMLRNAQDDRDKRRRERERSRRTLRQFKQRLLDGEE